MIVTLPNVYLRLNVEQVVFTFALSTACICSTAREPPNTLIKTYMCKFVWHKQRKTEQGLSLISLSDLMLV